jgi:hypothetical protein
MARQQRYLNCGPPSTDGAPLALADFVHDE